MTELVKSFRYYKMALNGLPLWSPQTHIWAVKATADYRKERMQILRDCELGYTHQLRNWYRGVAGKGPKMPAQEEPTIKVVNEPYE